MFRLTTPRLFLRNVPTTPIFFQFRGVHGIELKRGMVMDRNGRPLTVMQTQHVKTGGRGASYVQVDCKDIETGKRFTERVRSQEDIKLFEIERKYAQLGSYNITPGKGGKPIGTVTFELVDDEEDELTLDAQKLEWPAAYYYGGKQSIFIKKTGNKFLQNEKTSQRIWTSDYIFTVKINSSALKDQKKWR